MIKMVWAFLITFSMLIVLTLTQSHAQQVWTYDFGDETGIFDSGDSETFLPNPQTNGGTARVRVGSGGGSFTLENPGFDDLGTFSQLTFLGATSTSDNLFQIYEFEGSPLFYIRYKFRLSGGDSGIFGLLFGNGENFGGNAGYVGSSFAGIRSTLGAEGVVFTERRTSSSWSDAFSISEIFEKEIVYKIEIYVNNTETSISYYRNGEEFTLNSRNWSLWINGINENDYGSVGLSVSDNIDGFLFYGQNSDNNEGIIEIDDIVYSNSLPDIRTIEGDAGWRMLALPYNTSVEQLARQNMIQGIDGGDFPGALANLYSMHDGRGETNDGVEGWSAPANLNTTLNRGEGFIWGLYDNAAELQSKPLPMNLTITGTQDTGDVMVLLSNDNDGWNLLGNPFSKDLFVNNIESWSTDGDLNSFVAQVYNPETQNYELLNNINDKVSSFQGFFIQNDNASSITIPADEQTDGATFLKENEDRRLISFQVTAEEEGVGELFIDRAFSLFFSEQSEHGWDVWDATKLNPLSNRYIGIAFLGEKNGEPVLKAQDSRPIDLEESIAIPADFFAAGLDGTAELTIQNIKNIPADWTIEIEDTFTGYRQIVDSDSPFRFDFTATHTAKVQESDLIIAPAIESAKVTSEIPRFLFHLNPGSLNDDFVSQLPTQITLHQNYPNPFNPNTVISYELPQVADVQLQLFDMLGRQVATLVDGTVQAGTHRVTFDASNLSSGVYIYRLHTAEYILTRKLTVLK